MHVFECNVLERGASCLQGPHEGSFERPLAPTLLVAMSRGQTRARRRILTVDPRLPPAH
jgi:hypothetical protein